MPVSNAYNRDCMEAMKEFPDKFFELAVVDPPYGVGNITYMPCSREYAVGGFIDKYEIIVATIDLNQRNSIKTDVVHGANTKKTMKHFGDSNVAPGPDYFKELMRVSRHQIIWGGNYFLLPPSRCFLIWRKLTISESFSMGMCEFAWTSLNANSKWIELAPQGKQNDQRFHPTQKPIALYTWLLKKYANPGDKILDTHLGSGSSRIAAYKLGFDFWGYEIDKEYWLAQEKRFKTAIAEPLFDEIKKAEQGTLL